MYITFLHLEECVCVCVWVCDGMSDCHILKIVLYSLQLYTQGKGEILGWEKLLCHVTYLFIKY